MWRTSRRPLPMVTAQNERSDFRAATVGSGIKLQSYLVSTTSDQSCRSANSGSIRAARRAGNHPAKKATVARIALTTINVSGSFGATLNSSVPTSRVTASAPTTPGPMPISVSRMPCPTTNRPRRLIRAPRHRVRHHAVDANRGKQFGDFCTARTHLMRAASRLDDGFVFSERDIEIYIQREDRKNEAYAAAT